jgi:hypothetical protein
MNTQSTYWGGSKVLLGEPFIHQFYTVFDNQNDQVGLGIGIGYSTTNGPWIN